MLWNIQKNILKRDNELKVKIGPYISRFTTSGLEDFWYKLRYGVDSRWAVDDENTDKWDEMFEKVSGKLQTILNATVNKIQDNRKRKIKVKIDNYDVWSADHTLSLIILPTLKRLADSKHGSPMVDINDVPAELHPTDVADETNGYTDNTVHERWQWVLNEMIWTFEQLANEDNDSLFYDHSAVDDGNLESWKNIKIDHEGLKAHNNRIDRGTILFGKYYRALWD